VTGIETELMKIFSTMTLRLSAAAVFFMVMMTHAAYAAASEPVNITTGDRSISAGKNCAILEDRTGNLTLNSVISDEYSGQFRLSKTGTPNFGFTSSVYWVKLPLANMSGKTLDRLLEVSFPQLDLVEFHLLDKDSNLVSYEASGRNYAFRKRSIRHRNCVFHMRIPHNETMTAYLKISTEDGMIFPLTLWSPYAFLTGSQTENFLFGIFYGIILVMIFYNLFIYLSTRNRHYIFYVLFISSFGLFQLCMNGLASQYLWPGSPWWGKHSTVLFIALSCLFAALFSTGFLDMQKYSPRLFRVMQGLAAAGVLLAAASLTVNYSLTIIAGQALPALMIFTAIPAAIIGLMKGNKSARFYLTAWTVFFAGVLLSALRVAGTLPHNVITEYGLQLGSGIQMVLLSLALGDRINLIEQENSMMQEQHIENLNRYNRTIEETNALLKISEEKYRLIVEGSGDVIFTLDQEMNFINANSAIKTEFRLDPDNIAGLSFFDLLYSHEMEQSMFGILVKEKISDFLENKQPINFRALFMSSLNMEPKEMQVNLEYIKIQGRDEILGKMSNIISDTLLNCFIAEEQKYEIENYLIKAEEITQRITRNLKKYMQKHEIRMIQIALREVIINAIEHGNLNISFDEKTSAISAGQYFSLIRERQNLPENRGKKVLIEFSISSKSISYSITDEGDGFQYAEIMGSVISQVNSESIPHGRGLQMVKEIFDEISFNRKGNSVTLIKHIDRQP